MRYAGISVQKYDVKTHKKSRKHGVRARPLPRPVAGTGHGSRSHAPGLFPAGKAPPREGMPRRPGIDQSSRNDFCPIPSRESRHSRLPRRRLRLPSRACRKGARHTNRPSFRGHAAEPRLPSLYNIHQCSSFALLPVESRAAPPLQACPASRSPRRQWPFGNGTCRIPVSFLPRPMFRKDFCQLPRPFRPFSCIDMDTRNVYDCILNFVEQFQHITRQICSPIAARP